MKFTADAFDEDGKYLGSVNEDTVRNAAIQMHEAITNNEPGKEFNKASLESVVVSTIINSFITDYDMPRNIKELFKAYLVFRIQQKEKEKEKKRKIWGKAWANINKGTIH